MFGRVRRAVDGSKAEAYAVLRTYRPEAIATAVAVGLGAAGVGSGAAMARTRDGQQVSALGEAVTGTLRWGRREQRRYLRMPAHVLVVVTTQDTAIYEWTAARGKGREVARWQHGTVIVKEVRYLGEVGVHIETRDGKIAILTGRRGVAHPRVRHTVEAILAHAASNSTISDVAGQDSSA